MYFYKDSDIMTANITNDEEKQIKHHFIKFLDITNFQYDVW